MDFIRPIGPSERDVDPVLRVERSREERERRERERDAPERERPKRPEQGAEGTPDPGSDGPVEGDDGQLHVDVRA